MKKIAVFADVQNLYYTVRQAYGCHFNYAALWADISKQGEIVEAYAYARTGYHRGLDALRRNGWKGYGPVPWSHEPNRGFLRCLAALALSARAIGETDEWDRCSAFLRDSSPAAYDALLGD